MEPNARSRADLPHVNLPDIKAEQITDIFRTCSLTPKVSLGHVVITMAARDELTREDVALGLFRHSRGDWGEVDSGDWRENNISLSRNHRLLSSYSSKKGGRFGSLRKPIALRRQFFFLLIIETFGCFAPHAGCGRSNQFKGPRSVSTKGPASLTLCQIESGRF